MSNGEDDRYGPDPHGPGGGPDPGDEDGGSQEERPYRVLTDDAELSAQFDALVVSAQLKGYSAQELGFGLFSATTETLLKNGEPECCLMQLLVDFMGTFYESWHQSMSADPEPWQGPDPSNN